MIPARHDEPPFVLSDWVALILLALVLGAAWLAFTAAVLLATMGG
jgi:hypothetical protein